MSPYRVWSQPTEFADGVLAEAELGVRNVGGIGPVDDVRLAPEVPTEEGGAAAGTVGERGVECEVSLADAGMVEAITGGRLGHDGGAV